MRCDGGQAGGAPTKNTEEADRKRIRANNTIIPNRIPGSTNKERELKEPKNRTMGTMRGKPITEQQLGCKPNTTERKMTRWMQNQKPGRKDSRSSIGKGRKLRRQGVEYAEPVHRTLTMHKDGSIIKLQTTEGNYEEELVPEPRRFQLMIMISPIRYAPAQPPSQIRSAPNHIVPKKLCSWIILKIDRSAGRYNAILEPWHDARKRDEEQ